MNVRPFSESDAKENYWNLSCEFTDDYASPSSRFTGACCFVYLLITHYFVLSSRPASSSCRCCIINEGRVLENRHSSWVSKEPRCKCRCLEWNVNSLRDLTHATSKASKNLVSLSHVFGQTTCVFMLFCIGIAFTSLRIFFFLMQTATIVQRQVFTLKLYFIPYSHSLTQNPRKIKCGTVCIQARERERERERERMCTWWNKWSERTSYQWRGSDWGWKRFDWPKIFRRQHQEN